MPAAKRDQATGLTDKQTAFCREYLVDLNATAAARRAGYAEKRARDTASDLMAMPKIQAAIADLMRERETRTNITADRVLQELGRLAFFDIRKLYDAEGMPIPLTQLDEDTARAVIGIDRVLVGNDVVGVGEVLKMKLADKKGALELLGRHLGIFNDKLKIDGAVLSKVIKVPLKEYRAEQAAAEKQASTIGGPVPVPRKGGWKAT
ncbi:MAG: terminase small subunit [Aquincola sp.]|nr:terminase small subunit [Aquincola sp.]